jgi:hypothetical protein
MAWHRNWGEKTASAARSATEAVLDWLYKLSIGMDTEDGVIWVYGTGDEQVMAFTDFGIETLVELIKEPRSLSDLKS